MSASTCVRCGRPTDDGYACATCRDRARRDLLGDDSRDDRPGLVDTAPAARDIAHGLSSRSDGGGSGKPESRMPLDLAVTAKLDAVQGEMTTWARHVAEERSGRLIVHSSADPIVQAARYLAANVEWLRHRPEVDEAYAAIEACARVVQGIVRGAAEQKYLGPCGAKVTWDDDDNELPRETPCEGDVYAHPGSAHGVCRACKARWATQARRAWLDGQVREKAFRAAHIADAYGIPVKTIRSWAERGQLSSWWRTEAGLITPWIDPPLDPDLTGEQLKARLGEISDEIKARGGRLHYLGDVLDLAAESAARRESRRADRERRETLRETAEMGA